MRGKEQHTLDCILPPHVFVTSHGARGASQQLPYPPDWRGDIINVVRNIKSKMEKNHKINRLKRNEKREY